tara:strand:- start:1779 stop:2240 length:462 start_codon:yes stop_codon:yes gene_type:complete
MFVKVTNGEIDAYPYSVGKLRRENPRVSFPRKISEEMLASYGVHDVKWIPSPEHDTETHFVEYSPTPVLQDGAWVYAPTVRELSVEQIADRSVSRAGAARVKRDGLLSQSDWTQVADAPVSALTWATYRQALRDITSHANWPNLNDADWPTKP